MAIFSRKLKFPFNQKTPVIELALRWNRMLRDVEQFIDKFPRHILTLRYEDLLTRLEKELKSIAEFLAIPLDLKAVSQLKQKREKPVEGFILPSEPWKLEDFQRDMANTNDAYRNKFSWS